MQETTLEANRGRWPAYRMLAALFAMNLLNYIDRYVLGAVLGPVQESLEINDQQAGWLGSAFMVSYTLLSPFMGWMGDRVTRKYLLAGGVGLWSLATFGSGLARTYEQMLLARSLLGIGEATYAVIAPTLIGDLFPRKTRSRALAFFYVAIPVGAALGYMIGGRVEAAWGWQWAFRIVGLPGIVIAFAALFLREPRRGASEDVDEVDRVQDQGLPISPGVYAALARNRSYVFNTLAMAMMTFALGGLVLYTPKYLSTVGGMELKQANDWLGPVIALSGLIGTALGGWLGDWLAVRLRGAYFWMAGISSLAAVPFIAAAIVFCRTGAAPVLVFGSMGIGLTLVFFNTGPSNAIITNVTLPKIRAAAFAINIFFIHLLGDIPSPPMMGWVSDQTGMFWGLSISVPALGLSGLLYCLGARHLEQDQQDMLQQLRAPAEPTGAEPRECPEESRG